jgi:Glycosyl transferase family 2
MRLVLTVLARDEADVIDASLSFHLSAGVDFVVATDNGSRDGTREIFERYRREGRLHLIDEPAEGLRQSEWVTRMARLAASDFGADWVINSDADEFWWPRGPSLRDVLEAVPPQYGVIHAFWRTFVPRPDDHARFVERMTLRLTPEAPINDPRSFYRPVKKIAHRADPDVVVGRGNHGLVSSELSPLLAWHPLEVLHFPLRSREQWRRKVQLQGDAFTKYIERVGAGYHLTAYDALQSGRIEEQYATMVVDDAAAGRGLRDGCLTVDTRLRDALRAIGERKPPAFPQPTTEEEIAYGLEAALLEEADLVRLLRRADALEQRLVALSRDGAGNLPS